VALRNEQERKYGPLRFFRSGNLCNGADSWPGLFMNELLRSPIAAKRRASQAGVLLRGARQFAPQTAKQLASELPRAVGPRRGAFS